MRPTIARPSPVPLAFVVASTAVNARFCNSALIPLPVSLNSTVMCVVGCVLVRGRRISRDLIVSVQPEGPIQQAILPAGEPALSMAHVLASMGGVNAEMLERYTSKGSKF